MRLLRSATILAVVFGLALSAASAEAAQKGKGKKGQKQISGTVTNVEKGSKEGEATLTLKTVNRKTKEAKEVMVKVNKDTKIEVQSGSKKKGNLATTAGALTDIQTGRQAVITLTAGQTDQAQQVVVSQKKRKKNA